jgi:ribosomal protein S18 acetylase RimI-like enzyme
MSVDIVEMKIADYDELITLWGATEGVGLHPDERDSREGIARYLDRNPGTCFVARNSDKLVGAVLCGNDGRRGCLNHLAVVESYRRRGVGTDLVRRCTAALKEMGIPKCNLFVYAANEGATAFWHGLGWRSYDEVGVKAMMFMIE